MALCLHLPLPAIPKCFFAAPPPTLRFNFPPVKATLSSSTEAENKLLLQVKDLTAKIVEFDVEILHGVNLIINEGKVHAIMGKNGSRKSTFAKCFSYLMEKLKLVTMQSDFLNRNVNEGFSGGERKHNEILQLAVLGVDLAILDEIYDVDALRDVANHYKKNRILRRLFLCFATVFTVAISLSNGFKNRRRTKCREGFGYGFW